jgi:hypothetical protein
LPEALCWNQKKELIGSKAPEDKFWINELVIQNGFDVDRI